MIRPGTGAFEWGRDEQVYWIDEGREHLDSLDLRRCTGAVVGLVYGRDFGKNASCT